MMYICSVIFLQWQQGAGGICRYQVRVCGYRDDQNNIVIQNNWLFTQHISKDFDPSIYNYPVPIRLQITYAGQSCRERNGCNPRFSLLNYTTNTPQLPSTLGSGFMNRDNYENDSFSNITILPERTSVTYTEIHNFTLQPNELGLYLAVHDYGTCLGISRLRVYRNNCQGFQTGLVVYPDAPAPVSGSVNINVACVDNAVFSGSDQVTCASDGTWGPENPECQCSPGYEDRGTECFGKCPFIIVNSFHHLSAIASLACPDGEYRSADDTTCQQCPGNTEIDVEAASVCECQFGYFRNDENLVTAYGAQSFLTAANEGPGTACTSELKLYTVLTYSTHIML